jgi:hypothetical protein
MAKISRQETHSIWRVTRVLGEVGNWNMALLAVMDDNGRFSANQERKLSGRTAARFL